MDCSTPGFRVLYHLPERAQTRVHWVGDAIQPSPPIVPFSSCLQSFPASGSFLELALHIRWPKYWINSFSISPSNEYSELISFRIDWFDLLTFQGTLKSLLQHHTSKPSILWHSPFFMVQLSHPYMITGKTIALTRQTFVSKVMSLLFNIAVCHNFSSKKKVSFNFVAAVTICGVFGAHENKSLSLFPIYLPWSDRTRCHDLRFLNVEF